jgi:hypothetical protein
LSLLLLLLGKCKGIAVGIGIGIAVAIVSCVSLQSRKEKVLLRSFVHSFIRSYLARTTPSLVAIPRDVLPLATAFKAYSI